MKIHEISRLLRYSIVFIYFLLSFSISFAEEYTFKNISDNNLTNRSPKISNGQIVWRTINGNSNQINFYNGKTVITISDNENEKGDPEIENGKITWCEKEGDNNYIYLYDANKTENNISKTLSYTENICSPKICNGKVMWTSSMLLGRYYFYLHYFDGATYRNNFCDYKVPEIIEDKALWWTSSPPVVTKSYVWDGEYNTILNNYDGKLIWKAYDSRSYQVYSYDSTRTTKLKKLTRYTETNTYDTLNVSVSNGQAVWSFNDENSSQIYYSDGETPVNISNSSYNQITPNINNGEIVWFGLDKVDDIITFNLFYKKADKDSIKVKDDFSSYYEYCCPQVGNGQIVFVGSNNQIYLATPSNLTISNIGDGESIRLKWPKYEKDGKKIIYKISRKEESRQDWKEDPNDNDIIKIVPQIQDGDIVEYLDAPPDPKHSNILNSGNKKPKRGIVYDYKVEAIDSISNKVLHTYGGIEDTNLDGKYDVWKKGVTEPFIMLVRGWGINDDIYWTKVKTYLSSNICQFREEIKKDEIYIKPQTIWDTAISYNAELSNTNHVKIYEDLHITMPDNKNKSLFIGQVSADQAGEALFNELELWLEELKNSTKRIDPNTNKEQESPDYTPEIFYVISHSYGAPTSRALENLINKRKEAIEKKNTQLNDVPNIKINIMLAPATLGGASTWSFRSETGQDTVYMGFIQWASDKDKDWPATIGLTPENMAKFQNRMRFPSDVEYFVFTGNNWKGGGFGDVGFLTYLGRRMKYKYSSHSQWKQEADYTKKWVYDSDLENDVMVYLTPEDMKNDNSLTVFTCRGHFTKRLWNTLQNKFNEFKNTDKKDWEWQYNEDKKHDMPILPLNHYWGMVGSDNVMKEAWPNLKIPITQTESTQLLPTPMLINNINSDTQLDDAFSKTNYYKTEKAQIQQTEEKLFQFVVPKKSKWVVSTIWKPDNFSLKVTLIDPDDIVLDGENNNLYPSIEYLNDEGASLYVLNNPKIGIWKVKIECLSSETNGSEFELHYYNTLGMELEPLFIYKDIKPGTPFQIGIKLLDGDDVFTNANVYATITKLSDNTKTVIPLFDDGNHNDEALNDGIYSNEYTNTNDLDSYKIDISAQISFSNSNTTTLHYSSGFNVVEIQDITVDNILEERAITEDGKISNLEFDVQVKFSGHNPFVITADLFDELGNYISHGDGEVRGEPNSTVTATIYFSGNSIYEKQLSGPYILKNFFVTKINAPDCTFNNTLEWKTNYYQPNDFKFHDEDKDGLSDFIEKKIGTNTTLIDTDNDGLTDYQEVNFDGDPDNYSLGYDTNPLNPDTDRDGIIDSEDEDPIGIPNNAPIADIKGEIIYEATSKNGAIIFLDASGSCDLDKGDKIESYKWYGSFGNYEGITLDITLPLGEHDITLVVNDGDLDSKPLTLTVKVQDTTPPQLNVPEDLIVEATAILTPVNIGQATASDIFDVSVTNDAPEKFPLGQTIVTWVATDSNNNSVSGTQTITLQDTTPPEIQVSVSPNEIWPPNHKFVDIQTNVTVNDIFSTSIILSSITCNESATDFYQDADIGNADYNFKVKAEREGNGQDRIYSISYIVTDLSGNKNNTTITVTVPHDLSKD